MNTRISTKSGQSEPQTKAYKLDLKQVSDAGTFEGYGSVFGVEDTYSEVVASGAFKETLAEHKKAGTFPAMLWQHDMRRPIGVYTDMKEDDRGLFVAGTLALDVDDGKNAYNLLKMGALNGLSIGFMPKKSDFDEDTGIRTLNEIDLWEVSLVTFPANQESRVGDVKSALKDAQTFAELERHLRDAHSVSRSEATAIVAKCKEIERTQRDAAKSLSDLSASSRRLLELVNS